MAITWYSGYWILCRVVVQGPGPGPRYGHVMALVGQRYLMAIGGNDGNYPNSGLVPLCSLMVCSLFSCFLCKLNCYYYLAFQERDHWLMYGPWTQLPSLTNGESWSQKERVHLHACTLQSPFWLIWHCYIHFGLKWLWIQKTLFILKPLTSLTRFWRILFECHHFSEIVWLI